MDLGNLIKGIVAGFIGVVVALIMLPIALDQSNTVYTSYSTETWAPLLQNVVPIMLVITVVGIALAIYTAVSR